MKRSLDSIDLDTDSSVEIVSVIEIPPEEEISSQVKVIDLNNVRRPKLEPMYKTIVGNFWNVDRQRDFHKAFDDTIAANSWYNPVNVDKNTAINFPRIKELRVYGDHELIGDEEFEKVKETINTINGFRWRTKNPLQSVNFIGPILPPWYKNAFDTPVRGEYALVDPQAVIDAINVDQDGVSTLDMSESKINYILPWHGKIFFNPQLSAVRQVILPRTLKEITDVFGRNLGNMVKLNLGDSMTSIGEYTFTNSESLTSISFPTTLKIIGECAFSECTRLSSITIPSRVTKIGSGAFAVCGLHSLTFNPVYCSINDYAFIENVNLTKVNLTGTLDLSGNIFEDCDGLVDVDMSGATLAEESKGVFQKSMFRGCLRLNSIKFPKGVKEIEKTVFLDCRGLSSISLPSTVTKIGENCFRNCTSLTSITMPGLREISTFAFRNCGFTSFVGTDKIETIYAQAFSECPITSIDLRKSPLEYVHPYALAGMTQLTSIKIDAPDDLEVTESSFTAKVDGKLQTLRFTNGVQRINDVDTASVLRTDVVYFRSTRGEVLKDDLSNLGPLAIKLEPGIHYIDAFAMSYDTLTVGIYIPKSVVSISDKAFYECSELEAVVSDVVEPSRFRQIFWNCPKAIMYGTDN